MVDGPNSNDQALRVF